MDHHHHHSFIHPFFPFHLVSPLSLIFTHFLVPHALHHTSTSAQCIRMSLCWVHTSLMKRARNLLSIQPNTLSCSRPRLAPWYRVSAATLSLPCINSQPNWFTSFSSSRRILTIQIPFSPILISAGGTCILCISKFDKISTSRAYFWCKSFHEMKYSDFYFSCEYT